jgi:GTP diphosphokinase / guanosine-3',5'-bis(diphosphate) 3'-diphosphatase
MNKTSVQWNKSLYSQQDVDMMMKAEAFATAAHKGQKRKSGEPYIIHPVAVAQSLADWGMDAVTIAAGLLHDCIEDTEVSEEQLQDEFGPKVAELVSGVTKLKQVEEINRDTSSSRQESSTENIRKLLLAMSKDLSVILIKLADRKHNLMTLKALSPDKQRRIAAESLEIYAPLADRLGMGQLKSEIEDLSFRYVDPDEYARVERLMRGYVKKSQRYLAKLQKFIRNQLENEGIEVVSIEGRQKHLYSVYKKLAKTDDDIDKIYDLMAVRVLVSQVSDCYKTLGVLHQHFKPLIYRIKDYIAVPKPNGYRSLHTTVFALDGRITEIQIRTPDMHDEAERGLAAHFFYDSQKTTKQYLDKQVSRVPEKLNWVSGLADLHASAASGLEFVEALKIDLFQDRIFVFSPKGDLYDLPQGSTPVDFAFAVHSDLGLKALGARVNGKMVPLSSELANRDVVEILTRKQAAPSRDWLLWVKTPLARNRIKAWFRAVSRDSNIASGRAVLERELKAWKYKQLEDVEPAKIAALPEQLHYKDLDGVLAAVGDGSLTAAQVLRKLFPPPVVKRDHESKAQRSVSTGRVLIAKEPGLPYVLAPCCSPVFPEPLVGYVTRGSGITVHTLKCRNLPDEHKRWVDCRWEVADDAGEKLVVSVEVVAFNRIGLLRDVTHAISNMGININGLVSVPDQAGGKAAVRMSLEVVDLYQLARVISHLEELPAVESVNRIDQ